MGGGGITPATGGKVIPDIRPGIMFTDRAPALILIAVNIVGSNGIPAGSIPVSGMGAKLPESGSKPPSDLVNLALLFLRPAPTGTSRSVPPAVQYLWQSCDEDANKDEEQSVIKLLLYAKSKWKDKKNSSKKIPLPCSNILVV